MPTDMNLTDGYRATVLSRARDWRRPFESLHAFGGLPILESEVPASAHEGSRFHLTLDLDLSDGRLAGLGLGSLDRLAILANFDAEMGSAPLLIRHLDGGRRLELVAEPDTTPHRVLPELLPQLPVELRELTVAELGADSRDDYPDDLEPLHQVGGRPLWIGRPQSTPRCPESGEPMRFVAAVDSLRRFRTASSEVQLLFGDCGVLLVYWSDTAGISASVIHSF